LRARRDDLFSLLERLVELLTRLFTERVDAARGELTVRARGVLRGAAWAFAGGLLVAVGLAFAGAATVEALGGLIASRALRLVIVAASIVCAGAVVLRRGLAHSAADDRDDHGDERKHEQHVNPGADRVAAHHGEQPQNQQQHGQHPEHGHTSS
jgi:hypothetical protein